MDKLRVSLGLDSYDIVFEESFDELPRALLSINAPKKLLIVTDSNVLDKYAAPVKEQLSGCGYDVKICTFPAGEENKNMKTVLGICSACVEHRMDRKSMILALGGGVVGDMAGFAASIYMRGIRYIQIPTTLLSQSDSSVGGKTGVDFMNGKNILGAFHQPKLVYINVNTLHSLDDEQFTSGMGEVIKHAVIRDRDFFVFLRDNAALVRSLNPYILIKMAKTNCSIKAKVVEADERENGLRAILNFGHTIGHAIEAAYDFKMTHGQCVAIGMVGAGYIAYKRGMLSEARLDYIEEILDMYGFPARVKIPDTDAVYELMQRDKKMADGVLKFILPVKIGEVVQVSDITRDEIYGALSYISE